MTQPWYRTTLRWGQTNLVEIDPTRYDDAFWREQWRRTRVQGVIVNAGGIVAYYPSKVALHHRATGLGDVDLYGDVVRSARAEGLKLIARMDSNRVAAEFYRAHPDWICIDAEGQPIRQADKYVTCINSPYYTDYLPQILQEVIARSQPEGFADNSWTGLRRPSICYCRHCAEQFRAEAGTDLPRRVDFSDQAYRRWIRWSYRRRTEIWELNNQVTVQASGPDCRWMGMLSGDMLNNCTRLLDLRAILLRSEIVMLDHQRRSAEDGFEQNTEAGKRLHGVLGWDKLIPESMPQYQLGSPAFRLSSMPAAEVRLWSSAAFAGGIQPWWHHIGAMHEDRRQYATAEPIFQWHEANQDILVGRTPVADVGVVWSQDNHDFYGRDHPEPRSLQPYRGVTLALDREAVPFLPVHVDDIERAIGWLRVLILPNLAAMSEAQVAAIEAFATQGGSVIATSETSLYDQDGEPRDDFALAGLFGVHRGEDARGGWTAPEANIEISARHTYLRLAPELRSTVRGPHDRAAPTETAARHPVLDGFGDTDTLPFGGYLPTVRVESDVQVLATFIPDFPIFPPETAWMRTPKTDLPAIAVRESSSGARLIWFAADLDRCHAREEQFEHARLIANAARWAAQTEPLVTLEGARGFITPSLYRQDGRLILHLNNRIVTTRVPGRQNELVPIGPVTVHVRCDANPVAVSLRVGGGMVAATKSKSGLSFKVEQILDHEVAVLEASGAD